MAILVNRFFVGPGERGVEARCLSSASASASSSSSSSSACFLLHSGFSSLGRCDPQRQRSNKSSSSSSSSNNKSSSNPSNKSKSNKSLPALYLTMAALMVAMSLLLQGCVGSGSDHKQDDQEPTGAGSSPSGVYNDYQGGDSLYGSGAAAGSSPEKDSTSLTTTTAAPADSQEKSTSTEGPGAENRHRHGHGGGHRDRPVTSTSTSTKATTTTTMTTTVATSTTLATTTMATTSTTLGSTKTKATTTLPAPPTTTAAAKPTATTTKVAEAQPTTTMVAAKPGTTTASEASETTVAEDAATTTTIVVEPTTTLAAAVPATTTAEAPVMPAETTTVAAEIGTTTTEADEEGSPATTTTIAGAEVSTTTVPSVPTATTPPTTPSWTTTAYIMVDAPAANTGAPADAVTETRILSTAQTTSTESEGQGQAGESTKTATTTMTSTSAGPGWPPKVGTEGYLEPMRRCYLALPLSTEFGCGMIDSFSDWRFGLNEFGQDTSARSTCLALTRELGGDSFIVETGRHKNGTLVENATGFGICEVWQCEDRTAMIASVYTEPDEEEEMVMATSHGEMYSLLGFHDKYLTVKSEDNNRVWADSFRNSQETHFIMNRLLNGKVTLKHPRTGYVMAVWDGTLIADRATAGSWEEFDLVEHTDGTISLKSFHGLYISARQDGSALAMAPTVDAWEKFFALPVARRKPATPEERHRPYANLFSKYCEYEETLGGKGAAERRNPTFVKLWEWNYDDIAKECREWLGPLGVDGVQLSPVVEHRRGNQWWTKYQPISFGLETRAGGAKQFAHMVSECRKAGVEVMVDLILNHMGASCNEGYRQPGEMPCVGWNGSLYGNRMMGGARGWDKAGAEMFRHPEGNLYAGQCGVGPPSYLCGSLVTTDCSCCNCDLFGLPDWDTEIQDVLQIHYKHVKELHDMGVTMIRIDAALYEDVGQVSRVVNMFPWDYVEMEWWGEYPTGEHDRYLGNYRDVAVSWKITNALAVINTSRFDEILDLQYGTFGVPNSKSVYPITVHDKRTPDAVQETATYKNGLEFHQQQKFFLAFPWLQRIALWSGFAWYGLDDGPPGCEWGDELCQVTSVFNADGTPNCMDVPSVSPLPKAEADQHRWVCEHRWEGIAGLIDFRKSCGGLPMQSLGDQGVAGRLAFRVGEGCMVALVRGYNTEWPKLKAPLGDWAMKGLETGLPPGVYCNVASLTWKFIKGETVCTDKVVITGEKGIVTQGSVKEGDLLAIYTQAMISSGDERRLRLRGQQRQ